MSNKYIFNKTFRSGSSSSYNSCVGNNGLFHGKYFLGYKEAVNDLYQSIMKDKSKLDILIFPLLFSARHSIELFLKDAIQRISETKVKLNIKINSEIEEERILKSHDLKILWYEYESLKNKFDNRLIEYIDFQEEFIKDYFEIDPTGQTFRYQYSLDENIHLKDTPLINIISFYERYILLVESMEKTNYFIEILINEYKVGVFSKNLSREQIKRIAIDLPDYAIWKDIDFKLIKNEIKEKYKIGSKELSDVIKIIKSHFEFSGLIGLENKILESSNSDFIKIYLFLENLEINKISFDEFRKKILLFNRKDLIIISSLIELSIRNDYFSDDYNTLVDYFEKESDDELIYNMQIKNCFELIKKSLKILNQKSLLFLIKSK